MTASVRGARSVSSESSGFEIRNRHRLPDGSRYFFTSQQADPADTGIRPRGANSAGYVPIVPQADHRKSRAFILFSVSGPFAPEAVPGCVYSDPVGVRDWSRYIHDIAWRPVRCVKTARRRGVREACHEVRSRQNQAGTSALSGARMNSCNMNDGRVSRCRRAWCAVLLARTSGAGKSNLRCSSMESARGLVAMTRRAACCDGLLLASAPRAREAVSRCWRHRIIERPLTWTARPWFLVCDLCSPEQVPRMPSFGDGPVLAGHDLPLLRVAPFESFSAIKVRLGVEAMRRRICWRIQQCCCVFDDV